MHDSAQEAAMRRAETPDPRTTAHTKLDAALDDILASEQQHGVITVTLRRTDGKTVTVEVIANMSKRY